ncbi:uncharacterized protein TNCV_130081 [Trichonephila clavipes]|nr:uncharacterized protein TNCV_130081 [Trichonephila clavipes]
MRHWSGEIIYIGRDIPKMFFYKQVKKSSTQVITAQGSKCQNIGVVELNIRIRKFDKPWLFHVLADLEYPCILGIDFIGESKIILDFDRKSLAIQDSQIEDIKVDEGNLRVDVSKTKLNVVANVSDKNSVENIIGEKVNCAIIRDLVLSSREQLIEQQRTDPEFGYIYRYLENREDSSVNATICPYRVLDVKNNNIVIWTVGKRLTINVDQIRVYRHRKFDETEIGTGSSLSLSDNGSLRDESSVFDRIQRRSTESQDGKKKGSDVKRELEEKGLSFKNDQGEKDTNKTNKRGPLIRSINSSWSEKSRRIKRSKDEMLGYKRSHEPVSGGPERKIQKGSEHKVPKRALFSNYKTNSNLQKFRKKNRRGGTSSVQPQTTKWKKSGVPTSHREEDITGRTNWIQKKQRKERQPLHRRANKIKQQECQTRR